MPIPFYKPKPAPPAVFGGNPLPRKSAGILSSLFFFWIAPILKVGYSRPLEADDMWDLDEELHAKNVGNTLQDNYQARLPPSMRTAGYRPKGEPTGPESKKLFTPHPSTDDLDSRAGQMEVLANLTDQPGNDGDATHLAAQLTWESASSGGGSDSIVTSSFPQQCSSSTAARPKYEELVARFGRRKAKKIQVGLYTVEDGKVYDMSLWRAMYRSQAQGFWVCVSLLFVSYMLRIAAPLVAKVIIDEFTRAKAYRDATSLGQTTDGLTAPRSLGFSFAIAAALFVMLVVSSVFGSHAQQRWGVLGVGSRASVIDLIARKSLRLSGKSREEFSAGRINTMVTADAGHCDLIWMDSVIFVVLIPQMIAGCALLIWQLGVSALVAIAVLALSGPVQVFVFGRLLKNNLAHQRFMDQRVRTLTEVINHIREVKLYAYESLFGKRVEDQRNNELRVLRAIAAYNGVSASMMFFIPTLAAIATFIVYSALGNPLDAGTIFLSLQLLNILRQPIAWFPRIIAVFASFLVSTRRIGEMLQAEEDSADLAIDPDISFAVSVKGHFQYERAYKTCEEKVSKTAKLGAKLTGMKQRIKSPLGSPSPSETVLPTPGDSGQDDDSITKQPFSLRDINLQIPRGALVCVVGRVGAGKSTLLQALINEVKMVSGEKTFGGSISYVPQHAWVQSGTIRDNITFSSEPSQVDLERVALVTEACGLSVDLASLRAGDQTIVGERGITLSGGQRQRICIARAAYEDTDIVLLDDPLSAVDAQVGHHILHRCTLDGPLSQRTRVLVTHHLDVLPLADLVVMMQGDREEGRIVQQGSYHELMAVEGPFKALIEDYGSKATKEKPEDDTDVVPVQKADASDAKQGDKLHLKEDRETGTIAFSTYRLYFSSMGHWSFVLVLALLFITAQVASVANILWLGWWAGKRFDLSNGTYMGVYAGIGLVFALCLFLSTYVLAVFGLRASFAMLKTAWESVMRAPTMWHDRTPTGRIISRLSKDVDSMDTRIPSNLWFFLTNALVMVGTFGLVVYTYPWLGLTFIPIVVFAYFTFVFFQSAGREVKRIDSVQRSFVFGNLAEQLAGRAVIKAFRKESRFELSFQKSLDEQNKMYVVKWYAGSWLNMRIASAGQVLVLVVAIFGVATRDDSDPYEFGVVLTYVMTAAFVLQDLVPYLASLEQEMNSVERIANYTTLTREAEPLLPSDPSPEQWPTQGAISFEDVQLRYRADLPLVLKGLAFNVRPGEKVGIIGRTGAGKSSLIQALYRTVELDSGRILVDGQDLAALGLETVGGRLNCADVQLRSRLSIIPQESFLFAGTVREDIDPAGVHSDAKLNDILSLVTNTTSASSSLRDKFRLETEVQNEGSNFSAGERQLLALIRALVRGCKIMVLDEATSSVDPQTDALIQRIIQAEFREVTVSWAKNLLLVENTLKPQLISIAHRLQTVVYYDRILVMDAGRVAEFDTPLNLFDTPSSIFRQLCDTKQLSREDILGLRVDVSTCP